MFKWFDGKKTVIGAVITFIALLPQVAALLPVFGVSPQVVIGITGVLMTIIGLAHKAFKFLYKVEHE